VLQNQGEKKRRKGGPEGKKKGEHRFTGPCTLAGLVGNRREKREASGPHRGEKKGEKESPDNTERQGGVKKAN